MAEAQVFANANPYALGIVALVQTALTLFVLSRRAIEEVSR